MTTTSKQPDDWFRQMDANLGDASGVLVVPLGGEYTFAVPPGMPSQELVRHAETLLVENVSKERTQRADTLAVVRSSTRSASRSTNGAARRRPRSGTAATRP